MCGLWWHRGNRDTGYRRQLEVMPRGVALVFILVFDGVCGGFGQLLQMLRTPAVSLMPSLELGLNSKVPPSLGLLAALL